MLKKRDTHGEAVPPLEPDALRSLLWMPDFHSESAWSSNIPMASLLVALARPRTVVDITSNDPVPFLTFSQAVDRLGLPTRCYSVITSPLASQPDHTSTLREAIEASHTTYCRFSQVVEEDPVAASRRFDPGTIDLLHIGSLAGNRPLREIFEAWHSKLAPDATLLISGTNRANGDPEAAALFHDLNQEGDSFDLTHGRGVGVHFASLTSQGNLRWLVDGLNDPATQPLLSELFARLGLTCQRRGGVTSHQPPRYTGATVPASESELARVRADARKLTEKLKKARAAAAEADEHAQRAAKQITAIQAEAEIVRAGLEKANQKLRLEVETLRTELDDRYREIATLTQLMASQPDSLRSIARVALPAAPTTLLASARHLLRRVVHSTKRSPHRAAADLIRNSPLFDAKWYAHKYADALSPDIDPVEHYLVEGAIEGFNPGPHFDTKWYLSTYPDVARVNMNPLVHYLRYGRAEGRSPSSTDHPPHSHD